MLNSLFKMVFIIIIINHNCSKNTKSVLWNQNAQLPRLTKMSKYDDDKCNDHPSCLFFFFFNLCGMTYFQWMMGLLRLRELKMCLENMNLRNLLVYFSLSCLVSCLRMAEILRGLAGMSLPKSPRPDSWKPDLKLYTLASTWGTCLFFLSFFELFV